MVKKDALLLDWRIRNRSVKADTTQNSVALSLRPKIDQTKRLGRKVKTEKRL
jgi:hypothetical protein